MNKRNIKKKEMPKPLQHGAEPHNQDTSTRPLCSILRPVSAEPNIRAYRSHSLIDTAPVTNKNRGQRIRSPEPDEPLIRRSRIRTPKSTSA